jgi:hypothetical protein
MPRGLSLNLQDCKQLLLNLLGYPRVGSGSVQSNGLPKAVEIGGAVWTFLKVALQCLTLGGGELGVKLITDVVQNVMATNSFLLHLAM